MPLTKRIAQKWLTSKTCSYTLEQFYWEAIWRAWQISGFSARYVLDKKTIRIISNLPGSSIQVRGIPPLDSSLSPRSDIRPDSCQDCLRPDWSRSCCCSRRPYLRLKCENILIKTFKDAIRKKNKANHYLNKSFRTDTIDHRMDFGALGAYTILRYKMI